MEWFDHLVLGLDNWGAQSQSKDQQKEIFKQRPRVTTVVYAIL